MLMLIAAGAVPSEVREVCNLPNAFTTHLLARRMRNGKKRKS